MSALGRTAYLDQSTIIKLGFVLGSGLEFDSMIRTND